MPPQEMGHVKNGRSPSGAAIDHVECRRQEAVQIDYGPCEAIKPECLGAAGVAGMKYFAWHEAKDVRLKADRDVGFEDIVFHIERGDLLDVLDHRESGAVLRQRIFVVRRDDYVYFPSRHSPTTTLLDGRRS